MDKSIKLSCVIKMKKIGHSVPATSLVVSASTALGRAQQPCATSALAEAALWPFLTIFVQKSML